MLTIRLSLYETKKNFPEIHVAIVVFFQDLHGHYQSAVRTP